MIRILLTLALMFVASNAFAVRRHYSHSYKYKGGTVNVFILDYPQPPVVVRQKCRDNRPYFSRKGSYINLPAAVQYSRTYVPKPAPQPQTIWWPGYGDNK